MSWWRELAATREPDFIVGGKQNSYLNRWFIIPRNPVFNIYLHQFLRSDDDRALHDHPWVNFSILLEGYYIEHSILSGGINKRVFRQAGDWKIRLPTAAHRIEISEPCWTLFITGPRLRTWGFHCPDAGFVPWQKFVADNDRGGVGKGCNQ